MTAEQLAQVLGAKRSGRQWKCCCVAHEDKNPSMLIFDGRDEVQVRCMAGCEPADIIAALCSRGLWTELNQFEAARAAKPVSSEADRREHKLRTLARCVFDDAVSIRATLAQKYFERRDLWSVAREIEDIRFHPACPRESGEQPAVVIAIRSLSSNAVTAIQRLFLDRQGRKIGKGMMLGTCSGAAMKLQPKRGRVLHIAEGLETALAVIAMDHAPCWALGSSSLIQTFPVLDDVGELVIWADHDPLKKIGSELCRAGERAALICAQRWRAAGRQVDVFQSRSEGKDQADVWSNRCGRL